MNGLELILYWSANSQKNWEELRVLEDFKDPKRYISGAIDNYIIHIVYFENNNHSEISLYQCALWTKY